jgi:UDP-glucuronate 4-epimerase
MREDARCRPFSPYGVAKLAGENLCHLYWRNYEVPTVALRFFTVYGPRQRPDMGFHRFIRAIRERRPITVYGDGSQTRDFTHVTDITDGILAAVGVAPGSVYNLGGGSRVSLLQVMDVLSDVMGQKPSLHFTNQQAGDVRDTWAWLERSQADLGYTPRTTIEAGLGGEVEWLHPLANESGFPWGVAGL